MAMKLYYFDAAGRAEVARIMLKSSGANFTDVRFSREEWGQTYKKMSPTGQCPWLELPDGTLIAQTAAIEAYLMKKTGYCPADDVAEAKVWMMCACIGDLWQAIIPTFSIQDKEELLTARKALVAEGGGVKAMLDAMEKMLAASKTEFFASDKPSVADLNIFKTISDLKAGSFDGIAPEFIANYAHLVRIRDAVAKLPAIAAIYKENPKMAHYT